jgi:hypothetical protein
MTLSSPRMDYSAGQPPGLARNAGEQLEAGTVNVIVYVCYVTELNRRFVFANLQILVVRRSF